MFAKIKEKRAQRINGIVINVQRRIWDNADDGYRPVAYERYQIELDTGENFWCSDYVHEGSVRKLGLKLGYKVVYDGSGRLVSYEKVVAESDNDARYDLLRKPLPKNPCDACSSRGGCTSCERLQEYENTLAVYKEANLYDIVVKLEDIMAKETEINALQKQVDEACKYVENRGFDMAVIKTPRSDARNAIRSGFYGADGTSRTWNQLIDDGAIKVEDNILVSCDRLKFLNPGKFIVKSGIIIIRPEAFLNCSGIKEVEIPDSVRKIENDAFNGTCIDTLIVPKTVISIGTNAFRGINTLIYDGNDTTGCPWGALHFVKGGADSLSDSNDNVSAAANETASMSCF